MYNLDEKHTNFVIRSIKVISKEGVVFKKNFNNKMWLFIMIQIRKELLMNFKFVGDNLAHEKNNYR